MIHNPFITNGYEGKEYFCDRESETQQMINYLVNGNNVFLSSPRRLGKTGLIEHCFAQPEIKDHYITIIVDIYSTKNLLDFVRTLGNKVFSQLKKCDRTLWQQFLHVVTSLKASVSYDMSGNPELSFGLGNVTNPALALEQIFQYLEVASKPCLVAIDEFQAVVNYPEKNVEAILRTYIQTTHNAHFIFSGSHRHLMSEMFYNPSRPFFQSTAPLSIAPIDRDIYFSFAANHFSNASKTLSREAFDMIYDKFDGVTWYVQFLLNKMYTITQEHENCDTYLANVSIESVLKTFDSIFSSMLFQLPFKQKEILLAVAKDGVVENITSKAFLQSHSLTASSVQAAVKGLLEKDFITFYMGKYEVYDKFFALWLNQ